MFWTVWTDYRIGEAAELKETFAFVKGGGAGVGLVYRQFELPDAFGYGVIHGGLEQLRCCWRAVEFGNDIKRSNLGAVAHGGGRVGSEADKAYGSCALPREESATLL